MCDTCLTAVQQSELAGLIRETNLLIDHFREGLIRLSRDAHRLGKSNDSTIHRAIGDMRWATNNIEDYGIKRLSEVAFYLEEKYHDRANRSDCPNAGVASREMLGHDPKDPVDKAYVKYVIEPRRLEHRG